jgi:hypothetical protein
LIDTRCKVPLSSSFRTSLAVLLVELLDTTSGIHDLLGASVERVALGAHFNVQWLAHGGLGGKGIAAAAIDGDFVVLWMSVSFHGLFLKNSGAAYVRTTGARIIHKISIARKPLI